MIPRILICRGACVPSFIAARGEIASRLPHHPQAITAPFIVPDHNTVSSCFSRWQIHREAAAGYVGSWLVDFSVEPASPSLISSDPFRGLAPSRFAGVSAGLPQLLNRGPSFVNQPEHQGVSGHRHDQGQDASGK